MSNHDRQPLLYCLWRIDGDFLFTDLPIHLIEMDQETILIEAIKAEAELVSHMSEEDKEQSIKDQIRVATDPDFTGYIGYEMPLLFSASPNDVTFHST